MRALSLMLLSMTVLALPAAAQSNREDVERGRWLATQWCSACHTIAATAPGGRNDAAPSFPSIAAKPGVTAEGIATYVRLPHANMPDHGLTARQAQDLAAYILAQTAR